MLSVKVQEVIINIDGKDLTFRLDFNALDKYYSRYENTAMQKINNIITGTGFYYKDIVNILECSCIDRDFVEGELMQCISMDVGTLMELDRIGTILLGEILTVNEGNSEKN